jgi:hypothetical protein
MLVEYIDKTLNKIVRINPGDHIIYHKNGNLPLKAVFIQCNGYLYILDIKEDKEINMPNVRWTIILQENEYLEIDKQYYRDNKLNQLLHE